MSNIKNEKKIQHKRASCIAAILHVEMTTREAIPSEEIARCQDDDKDFNNLGFIPAQVVLPE